MSNTQIIIADARDAIAKIIPENSVDCIVTSPPYWGLRDYGTEGVMWENESVFHNSLEYCTFKHTKKGSGGKYCYCGNWKGELGQEFTSEEFIYHLVEVINETDRILKDTGSVWVNLGDKYTNKNLEMIPARFALKMRERGWTIADEVIWEKMNGIPEAVNNRLVRFHEHVFRFVKDKDKAYFDWEAIATPFAEVSIKRAIGGVGESNKYNNTEIYQGGAKRDIHKPRKKGEGAMSQERIDRGVRPRNIWKMSHSQFHGNHFAAFPETLPDKAIKCTTKEGDMVYDPFGGAGTTAVAASRLDRNCIISEINREFAEIAKKRIIEDAPMFNSVEING